MSTWGDRYRAILWELVKDLPEDMPLKERIRFVDDHRLDTCGTSWGKKAWLKVRREYLVKFGYVPRTGKRKAEPEAPPLPLFK